MSRARAAESRDFADRKAGRLLAAYRAVRDETERRAFALSAEDQMLQSMPDASPAKWHRAHTSWFFEEFILRTCCSSYLVFDPGYAYLFNSYYEAVGPRHARPRRGLLSRPSCGEITAYRRHVDEGMAALLLTCSDEEAGVLEPLLRLGLAHEEQHQELMLTDILHAFWLNPMRPAYDVTRAFRGLQTGSADYASFSGGLYTIGADADAFAFDNEGPAHQVFVQPFAIGTRLVTNRDWLSFMDAGGYGNPTLWHSDGWSVVEREGWDAPLYWERTAQGWQAMGLAGLQPIEPDRPVCHISFYEAAAYARFAGQRLPSEQEWEIAARADVLADSFGTCWQWTQSPYIPYPGFRPAAGAVGEYNGKFMINQIVLRGSSEVTAENHARMSYRNFFYPHQRWQFTGLRLACDGARA